MAFQIPTPLYDLMDFPNVYEPREDTFLLLDALEKDYDNILKNEPMFVAEVGSGSGILITALSSILKTTPVSFASDVNIEACSATLKTSQLNRKTIEIINMNFLDFFKHNMFDLIIFNPPYVVTESKEILDSHLSKSWAGGVNGREIIDKFLFSLRQYLCKNGVCYLLVLKENKPEEILKIGKQIGFRCEVLMDRKVPSEHLFVLKLSKL